MRPFRRFFLSSPEPEAALAVFFAPLVPSVVLAGALDAVDAGALPAVDAGLGAISDEKRLLWVCEVEKCVLCDERGWRWWWSRGERRGGGKGGVARRGRA